MKIPYQIKNILFIITLGAFTILVDIYFANIFFRAHKPVVNGILGVTVMILLFRIYIAPKQYEAPKHTEKNLFQYLFTYPAGIKFLIFCIFWVLVINWAITQIIDMFSYLLKFFR